MYVPILARILVLSGALNWFFIGSFNWNPVHQVFKRYDHIVYILVGIAAIYLLVQRDYYLPFLGDTAFPQSLMTVQTPANATTQAIVQATPGSKVVYWAAEPGVSDNDVRENPRQAYRDYKNAGVTITNSLGEAILKVKSPSPYLAFRRLVKPHIHYRVSEDNPGMWGPVQTVYLE